MAIIGRKQNRRSSSHSRALLTPDSTLLGIRKSLMEAKLRFQIKNLLASKECDASDADQVLRALKTSYPENRRKAQVPLTKAVLKILGTIDNSKKMGKKRGREAQEEVAYDASAAAWDEAGKDASDGRDTSSGSALNRALGAQYMSKAKGGSPAAEGKNPRSSRPRKTSKNGLANGASATYADFLESDDSGKASSMIQPQARPGTRYSDLGGLESVIKQVQDVVVLPLCHPEVYNHLGVDPPRGVLLHGPPGCGKTLLANAIAGELGCTFFSVSAPEVVSGMSGESEQRLRQMFSAAIEAAPALIFLDEVDAITPKRDTVSRSMEKRIVAQLITCLDSLASEAESDKSVVVIGATNRPDALDQGLRRAGRFDREICLGVPDEKGREKILQVLTRKMRLDGAVDLEFIAKKTPGFVGADLTALAREAAAVAVTRVFEAVGDRAIDEDAISRSENRAADTTLGNDLLAQDNPTLEAQSRSAGGHAETEEEMESTSVSSTGLLNVKRFSAEQLDPLFVTMADFQTAIPRVQPSAKREGFATQPDVTWDDVGALQEVREELELSVVEPIERPERFRSLGLTVPAGVLLWGPPGCGKTLLAKACAAESSANFISVKGPELLDKYVGESERAVRQVFQRARESAPCVIFFDELDAICPKRGAGTDGGSGVSERVVNQLLTEMDGAEARNSVFVIAATNRPDMIDPAMLRPGRLDKLLLVPLPGPEARGDILQAICKKVQISRALRERKYLDSLGRDKRLDGFSGADLASLVREAGMAVLREAGTYRQGRQDANYKNDFEIEIREEHFEAALKKVGPSVVGEQSEHFDDLRRKINELRRPGAEA